jgi:hypothetical protein
LEQPAVAMVRRRSMKTDCRKLDGVRSPIMQVMGCGIVLMEVCSKPMEVCSLGRQISAGL